MTQVSNPQQTEGAETSNKNMRSEQHTVLMKNTSHAQNANPEMQFTRRAAHTALPVREITTRGGDCGIAGNICGAARVMRARSRIYGHGTRTRTPRSSRHEHGHNPPARRRARRALAARSPSSRRTRPESRTCMQRTPH